MKYQNFFKAHEDHFRGHHAKDNKDRPAHPHIPTGSIHVATVSVPSLDRILLLLLAIKRKKTIPQMEIEIGASRQIVQRYLGYLKRDGFVTAEMGPSGKKAKNRGHRLTKAGEEFLEANKADIDP